MVNIEYYNQASYAYLDYKSITNKKIKCIIYDETDKSTIQFLANYFHIDLANYQKKEYKGFSVLSLKDYHNVKKNNI